MTIHPAVANADFSWRDVWPSRRHRGVALPPGQRLIRAFPRFADNPLSPLPSIPDEVRIHVGGAVNRSLIIAMDTLTDLARVDRTADFHCVTTWSLVGLRWSGWSFADLWHDVIAPTTEPDPAATWLVATGLDGYRARLRLDDVLADDVLIADTLEGRPLEPLHGAPLRLISPSQYAYKSVKHLTGLEIGISEPPGVLGAKEHPRARVDREERHTRLPSKLLRWPYRLVVPPTALIARRTRRPDV